MSDAAAPQATETPAAAAEAPAVAAAAEVPLLGADAVAAEPAAPEAAPAAAEAKPADPNAVPEAYVIALPEGEAVDEGRLTAYQGALKDAALTQAQADKLTPFLLGQMKAMQEQQLSAWADTTKAWRGEVVADPDIGGAKLAGSMVLAARARDAFGSPEFKAFLADANLGIGNHPALVRFMVKAGASLGEDLRGADQQGRGSPGARDQSAEAQGARRFGSV